MTTKYDNEKRHAAAGQAAGPFFGYSRIDRVRQALDSLMDDTGSQKNPIEEQLKQCPEAFKAGELLERALDSLKYDQNELSQEERWLPPAGAIIPPLV